MVASSSTFRTHLGRVMRDLSRLLHVEPHDTRLQRLSKGSCSLHVTNNGYKIVVDCQRGSLFPSLNSGADAAHASVQALMLAMLEP